MELVRPCRCKGLQRIDWRSVYYSTQACEVVLICIGILTTHWLEGKLVPVPWIRVQMDIGLLETCLSWQDYTACAKDVEVLQMMADALGKHLDYIQEHTFDIPRSFLYVVLGVHFCTVAVLFSDHPLGLPRFLNIVQLLFLAVSLGWFGLSSFKQDMCNYLVECSFGWSLYLILVATLLALIRLIYHLYRFRKDGEDDPSFLLMAQDRADDEGPEDRTGLGGVGRSGGHPSKGPTSRLRRNRSLDSLHRSLLRPSPYDRGGPYDRAGQEIEMRLLNCHHHHEPGKTQASPPLPSHGLSDEEKGI